MVKYFRKNVSRSPVLKMDYFMIIRTGMDEYSLSSNGQTIPFVWQRLYLGVTVGRDLTWTGQINGPKSKLVTLIVSVCFVSVATCGTAVLALPRLCQVLSFGGVLCYVLPSFNNPRKIDVTTFLGVHGRYLWAWLWPPLSVSATIFIGDSHHLFIPTLQLQDTPRLPLGRLTEHRCHHLDNVLTERSFSRYGRI